uniref:CD96 molecule n=1 Tax=Amazona collaria TaxID=241587 RepID=A0A8B9FHN1_9PSIT
MKDFHFHRGTQGSHFSPVSVTGAPCPLPDKCVFALPVLTLKSLLVEICCKPLHWKACFYSCRVCMVAYVITQTEVVHALPGTDVTLVCSFPKPHTTYIIQTQWSKTDDTQLTKIAVYHPVYGTHYFTFPEASHNFSSECSRWALHLKNVTISLSGQYES